MLEVKVVSVMRVYMQPPTKQINSSQLMFLFYYQGKKNNRACQAILRSFKKAEMQEDMKCTSLNEWITNNTSTWTTVLQDKYLNLASDKYQEKTLDTTMSRMGFRDIWVEKN